MRASGLPCCSTVLVVWAHHLLSVDIGRNLLPLHVALSGMLQIAHCPLPYVVTFDSQMSDGKLPAVAGMLQEAPAKPSPTALQGMMLLDQLGSADARGQFISWQSM